MKRHTSLIPLSHEHQHGLALTVMIARKLKPPEELRDQVAAMWDTEFENHFRVEEQFVFPAVRDRIKDRSLVETLVAQHRALERFVELVKTADEEDLPGVLDALGELLTRHIRTEERQLFEQAQSALSEDELQALGESVERESRRACPTAKPLTTQGQQPRIKTDPQRP